MHWRAILIAGVLLVPALAEARPCRKRAVKPKASVTEHHRARRPGPQSGDTIIYSKKGSFFGLGVEHYLSKGLSLAVEGGVGPLDGYRDRDGDLVGPFGANFPTPVVPSSFEAEGFSYIATAAARFHGFRGRRFNPYFGAGVSYFGYHVETPKGGGGNLDGASLLLRLGAGVRYHFGRLAVGFDSGWYPLEIARMEYGGNLFPVSASGDPVGDDGELRDGDDAWVWNRFTASFNVGFRF